MTGSKHCSQRGRELAECRWGKSDKTKTMAKTKAKSKAKTTKKTMPK